MMVRDFQRIIGDEMRGQCTEAEGRLPDYILACVGGGSNAAGIFYPFIDDESVKLIGIEAGGKSTVSWRTCRDAFSRKAGRAAWGVVVCASG